MIDLENALSSGDIMMMIWVAAALGFIHTILGPDHYVPFVMMAKAEKWSRLKTAIITLLCGLGHVGSSVVIAVILVVAGTAVSAWSGTRWAAFHEWRGSIAAWLLMGVGAAFFVWGIIRAKRKKSHTHIHVHDGETLHTHEHGHEGEHAHVHKEKVKRSITPWVLFVIFIFGPCESLIPLMLAAWAVSGLGGTLLVAGAFSITTVAAIMGAVSLLLLGISRIPIGKLDRYSLAAAGVALIFCGASIEFLGL